MPTHTSGQANFSFNSREYGTGPKRGQQQGSESAWGRDKLPEPGVLPKEMHEVTALALFGFPECPGFLLVAQTNSSGLPITFTGGPSTDIIVVKADPGACPKGLPGVFLLRSSVRPANRRK